ncbi:uncharacterized protein RCC_05555 [Ramularia collo-cygni]|uniref:Uncharacterized protein n=1 Tax=Ramularia collo-cygni TaxID=112498 RepID=A0A2D3VGA5_9PEZI|nr:uncharacterized protein RCC_05555 [Ramularia collo-cygni]CZT19703.1 uncharacterized protein RCC_05555 [Ramularia collo-cygni]
MPFIEPSTAQSLSPIMPRYFVQGSTFRALDGGEEERKIALMRERVYRHEALSYRRDWYAGYDDLPAGGEAACERACRRLNNTHADILSIPTVRYTDVQTYAHRINTKHAEYRMVCAFSSFDQNGKIDCLEAARQFAQMAKTEVEKANPVSFLRKLMDIHDEIHAVWRREMGKRPDEYLPGSRQASVEWNGKPLRDRRSSALVVSNGVDGVDGVNEANGSNGVDGIDGANGGHLTNGINEVDEEHEHDENEDECDSDESLF